ncbi:MAG: hypothetical protein RLZZ338_410 [Cyanobacteriota bacterium]|jgi:hypothetical protein
MLLPPIFLSTWYKHEVTKTQRKEKRVRAVSPEMRWERAQGIPLGKTLCLGVFVVNFISPTYHAIATNFFVNMV